MQHIIGMVLNDNEAEIMDDDTIGEETRFFGLFEAVEEGKRRLQQNPNIKHLYIYEVATAKKTFADGSKYQRVHQLR